MNCRLKFTGTSSSLIHTAVTQSALALLLEHTDDLSLVPGYRYLLSDRINIIKQFLCYFNTDDGNGFA